MFQVKTPVLRPVADPEDIGGFFNTDKRILVPHYGNEKYSSQNFLTVLFDLTSLSSSFNTVRDKIQEFAFSSSVSIQRQTEPCLIVEGQDTSVNAEQSSAFVNFMKDRNFKLPMIKDLCKQMDFSYKWSGNIFLKIKRVTVGSTILYFYKVLSPLESFYIYTKPGKQRFLLNTPELDEETIKKKGRVYPVSYMNKDLVFNKGKQGVEETVLHIANHKNGSVWYGQPNISSIMEELFIEYKETEKCCKNACTDIIAKGAWLFPGLPYDEDKGGNNNKDDNFRVYMRELKTMTTNEGDISEVSSMVGLEYPQGTDRPEWVPMDYKINVESTKFSLESARNEIYANQGWFPELTGKVQAKSGIGDSRMINLYIVANQSTVKPLQEDYQNYMGYLFSQIAKHENVTEYQGMTIKFTDKVEELVTALRGTENESTPAAETNPDPDGT